MLISVVLVMHLTLVVFVVAGFIYRYVLAFKNKSYPRTGRNSVFVGTAGLVITGVLLAVIGKLPVTSLCLDSLGIIIALIVMEVGLYGLSNKLANEKQIN